MPCRHSFSQESGAGVPGASANQDPGRVRTVRVGGVINILTKSGTNQLAAAAGYYFLRDDAFDKPNAFATGKVPFKQQTFGATAGGPIVRDKVHFFASYERQLFDDVVTVRVPDVRAADHHGPPHRGAAAAADAHNLFGKVTISAAATHYLDVTALGTASRTGRTRTWAATSPATAASTSRRTTCTSPVR